MSEIPSSSNEQEITNKVIKLLNFDGLTIEVIQKNPKTVLDHCGTQQAVSYSVKKLEEPLSTQKKEISQKMICSNCQNIIEPGCEVIMASDGPQGVLCWACPPTLGTRDRTVSDVFGAKNFDVSNLETELMTKLSSRPLRNKSKNQAM